MPKSRFSAGTTIEEDPTFGNRLTFALVILICAFAPFACTT